MNENDEDVVHAGILSKSKNNPGIQADFVIRHRQDQISFVLANRRRASSRAS